MDDRKDTGMKKIFLTFIAALFVFCGCNNSKSFEVTLNLRYADGLTYYLCKNMDGADVVVDSARVVGDKAVMTAPYDDLQMLYSIKQDKDDQCGAFTFFSENQNTMIEGDSEPMAQWKVKGCATMDVLMDFHESCMEKYERPIMSLMCDEILAVDKNDTLRMAEIDKELAVLVADYHAYQADFIRSHSGDYYGHYMLDLCKRDFDLELVEELAGGLTTETVFRKNVQDYIVQKHHED